MWLDSKTKIKCWFIPGLYDLAWHLLQFKRFPTWMLERRNAFMYHMYTRPNNFLGCHKLSQSQPILFFSQFFSSTFILTHCKHLNIFGKLGRHFDTTYELQGHSDLFMKQLSWRIITTFQRHRNKADTNSRHFDITYELQMHSDLFMKQLFMKDYYNISETP